MVLLEALSLIFLEGRRQVERSLWG